MKKYQILLASLLTATAAFAQTDSIGEAPNRILVTNANGNYKGFVIDHLDAINFARVDGEVLAKVEVNEVATDSLRLTVKRTPDCQYYKLAVISQTIANQMPNDLSAISYINSMPSSMVPVLSEDFDNGLLSGVTLQADSDYAIMTVGFDNYGVEAGVFRCDFSTPAPVIVGNPQVEAEVVDTRLDSFTISFTPNDDVQSYWCVAGEKGVMQSQYEMFGPIEYELYMTAPHMRDVLIQNSEIVNFARPGVEKFEVRKPEDGIQIIVNGSLIPYDKDAISYEQLGKIVYGDSISNQQGYTVAYKDGPDQNPSGILSKGNEVFVKHNMKFDVTRTHLS